MDTRISSRECPEFGRVQAALCQQGYIGATMLRRSLLAAVAVSSGALAGCSSTVATIRQDSTTTAEVPSDPDDPIAEATTGFPSADRSSHRVRLWNLAAEGQSVGLELESDNSVFDGSYDLDPDAHILVLLYDPAEYEVAVTVDDTTVGSTTLEAESFDEPCPSTELFVLEDGEFELETESEADYC